MSDTSPAADPVRALLNRGSIDQWSVDGMPPRRTTPLDGIGTVLGASSFTPWPGYSTSSRVNLWRNPALWEQIDQVNGRWITVKEWQRRLLWGDPLGQFFWDWKVTRTPFRLPWELSWSGAGGQTLDKDNGLIIRLTADGTAALELQGFAPLTDLEIAAINFRCAGEYAHRGEYRCDGLAVRPSATGLKVVGSQGPVYKEDPQADLLRPEDLSRPWSTVKRLVVFNVSWGTGATAAPGGRVEHTAPLQPYLAGRVKLPMGDGPDMVRCFQGFIFDITDTAIEAWLDSEKASGALRESKRNYARGWRGDGLPKDAAGRPIGPSVRVAESGTGTTIMEPLAGANVSVLAEYRTRGVDSESVANQLGHGMFPFGQLRAA